MSAGRIQALVEQLRSFRTRSAAAGELIASGRDAVGPLLEALKDKGMEDARWTIVNCLGELRAPQAVPALASFLERGDCQTVAHDALVKIAGKDVGPLPADWLRWAEHRAVETGEPLAAAAEPEAAPPTDARLMELALAEGVAACREEEPGRYAVGLALADGVAQEVTVAFGAADQEGAEIVIVYSGCGEARREHYETALRLNLHMPYGAIALRDVGGKPHFVMFDTILRQALTPIELRKSIFTVGERAHRVTRDLHR